MFLESDSKFITPETAPAFLAAATMTQKAILNALEKSDDDYSHDSELIFELRRTKAFIKHCLKVMNEESKVTTLTVVQDERH
jgi:hypothetical protein